MAETPHASACQPTEASDWLFNGTAMLVCLLIDIFSGNGGTRRTAVGRHLDVARGIPQRLHQVFEQRRAAGCRTMK